MKIKDICPKIEPRPLQFNCVITWERLNKVLDKTETNQFCSGSLLTTNSVVVQRLLNLCRVSACLWALVNDAPSLQSPSIWNAMGMQREKNIAKRPTSTNIYHPPDFHVGVLENVVYIPKVQLLYRNYNITNHMICRCVWQWLWLVYSKHCLFIRIMMKRQYYTNLSISVH